MLKDQKQLEENDMNKSLYINKRSYMKKREEIQQKYDETQSYEAVAKLFSLSRQRVHQIITGYTTIDLRTKKKLKEELDNRGTICEKCNKNKYRDIHHLDGNSRNNDYINLKKLCKPCHNSYHIGIQHKSKYRGKICAGYCGRIMGIEVKLQGKMCNGCMTAKREGRTIVSKQKSIYDKDRFCGVCGASCIGKAMKKGMCSKHFNLWRYFFDQNFLLARKKSYQKRRYSVSI